MGPFFEIVLTRKGFRWLSLIEKDLREIADRYRVEYPEVYNSSIYELEVKYERIEKEHAALLESLNARGLNPDNIISKDPLAQVYKEDVFRENMLSDIDACRELGIEFAFFIIEVDNLQALNLKYGRDAGDEILVNASYLLKNFKKKNKNYAHHLIFRLNGPRYVYYCTDVTRDEIIGIAEDVRNEFRESMLFITSLTVSSGLVHSAEFCMDETDSSVMMANIIGVANSRLRLARHRGTDSVCSDSETDAFLDNENYVLVVDSDESARHMLDSHLKRAGFNVMTCALGDEALEKVDIAKPVAIISGLFLPKMDGFSLRKKLLEDSSHKNIPFILTSALKDEASIVRAQSLDIFYYFKKPYSIVEVTGLVKSLAEK